MNQKIHAKNIKIGNIIEINGKLFEVRKKEHVKPGKGGAFIQVELQGTDFNQKLNERFRPEETLEKAIMEEQNAQFLYEDGGNIVFMFENGEQFELNKSDFAPLSNFLTNGTEVKVEMHDGNVISFRFLQDKISVKIASADPSFKGQTAASSYKNAVLENGEKILVPTYIEAGDHVLIDPNTLEYAGRA
ncbi:MAG: elongation factor P [Alphaproteobacteria bacterium]|nr:MAG: elongation factor P [Alphaproteobacteria bacterium]